MPYELLFIALITFSAAFLQGLSGFGNALLAMSFLPFVMTDVHEAVPYVALNAIIISAANFLKEKKHFVVKEVSPAIMTSIPGILIGVYLLKNVDSYIIKKVLGVFLVTYSCYSLKVKLKARENLSEKWGYFYGFLAGIMGGAFTINGPFMVFYCSLKYNNKRKVKVLLSSFFVINGCVAILMYALTGLITAKVGTLFAYNVILTILGVMCGNYFYDKINPVKFRQLVYLILLVSGFMMLVKN